MKGSIEGIVNFLIYVMLFVTAVLTVALIAGGAPIGQHECIAGQSGEISDLKFKMGEASGRDAPIPYPFDVLGCVKCMWYNKDDEKLIVVYSVRKGFLVSEELMEVPYNISTQFVNIGCNCNDCDDRSGDTYCANLRNEDSPYPFKINRTHIDCEGCISSKPCSWP